ncbi:MAG: NAD(P)-dependent oxidoreductase [Rhizobiaceae bacterium]
MNIVITGAAGFLGQELVRQLAGRHDLYCLTRQVTDTLPGGRGVHWIAMDLSAGLDRSRLPARADAIIHLAQSNGYRNFPDGAPDVFAVNIRLVQELCEYGLSAGITRLVLASTGTVYEPFAAPLHEDSALRPTGYYGASKLAAELISGAYSGKFAVSNLRVFFLYGPGQRNMLIARLIDNVRAGQKVTLPADGEGLVFVPTYVGDTAGVFVRAVEDGWSGPINVASPHAISLGGLLRTISAQTGMALNVERTDAASPGPIVPDLARLAERIDLATFLTPGDGIRRTLAGA